MSESSGADPSPEPATVLDRMLAAGLNEQRAREHLDARRVRVAGVEVDDPDYPAPRPTPWMLSAP